MSETLSKIRRQSFFLRCIAVFCGCAISRLVDGRLKLKAFLTRGEVCVRACVCVVGYSGQTNYEGKLHALSAQTSSQQTPGRSRDALIA